MKKNYFFLAIILFLTNSIYSQQCSFDIKRFKLRQSPEYIALEKAAEQRIQVAIKSGDLSKRSSHILTIPIVIQVLHLGFFLCKKNVDIVATFINGLFFIEKSDSKI